MRAVIAVPEWIANAVSVLVAGCVIDAFDTLVGVSSCAAFTFGIARSAVGLDFAIHAGPVWETVADFVVGPDGVVRALDAISSSRANTLGALVFASSGVVPCAAIITFPVLVALACTLVAPVCVMNTDFTLGWIASGTSVTDWVAGSHI